MSHWWYCDCCPWSCQIGIDDFNRANSTDLGAKWEEKGSGTAAIEDNYLKLPAGSGTVLHVSDSGYDRTGAYITVKVPADKIVSSAVYRLVFNYVSEASYVYVDFRTNALDTLAKIYIGVRASSVDTDYFWNDMDVGLTDGIEAGYEPEGNGLIWVDTADSSDGGGDRLLEVSVAGVEKGKAWGLANGGSGTVYFDDFYLYATVDSDEEQCRGFCIGYMLDTAERYIMGVGRSLDASFSSAENCSGMDGYEATLIQIENESHPDYPGQIDEDGLSYQAEWRSGTVNGPTAGAEGGGGTPTANWSLRCYPLGSMYNSPPATLPGYAFTNDPDCIDVICGSGCHIAVGVYDSTGAFDKCPAFPDTVSTNDPLYLKHRLHVTPGSGDEDCAEGYTFFCNNCDGLEANYWIEITETA